jgi:hypothetical protein
MVDPALSNNLASAIQHAGPMELRPPIEPDIEIDLIVDRTFTFHGLAPFQDSAAVANVTPVLALNRRELPTGLSATGHPDRTRLHFWR